MGVLPWWGERWHKAAFVFFLLCWALCVAVHLKSTFAPNWMTNLVLFSGLLSSFVTLGRQLPLQNVVIVGMLFSFAGAVWGWFVGPSLDWNDGRSWRATNFWTVFWTIVLLNARAIGQYLLRSRRGTAFYGWELMGMSAFVFACVAALYTEPLYIAIAPLVIGGLLFITLPFLLSKRTEEPPVSWLPIVVLILMVTWGRLPRI
jgi:hypothetical protein